MSPNSAGTSDGTPIEKAYDLLVAGSAEDDIEDLFAIQAEALRDDASIEEGD